MERGLRSANKSAIQTVRARGEKRKGYVSVSREVCALFGIKKGSITTKGQILPNIQKNGGKKGEGGGKIL